MDPSTRVTRRGLMVDGLATVEVAGVGTARMETGTVPTLEPLGFVSDYLPS